MQVFTSQVRRGEGGPSLRNKCQGKMRFVASVQCNETFLKTCSVPGIQGERGGQTEL